MIIYYFVFIQNSQLEERVKQLTSESKLESEQSKRIEELEKSLMGRDNVSGADQSQI